MKAAILQLQIFGLFSVRLDIREDSSRWNVALGEILRALDIASDFEHLPGPERTALLLRLLGEPDPVLSSHPGITTSTAETWSTLQLIGQAVRIYGPALLGTTVVSMTHSPADVLTVLLLARWAKCDRGLSITPLFESIADLREAANMLDTLFASEAYRAHLASCNNEQIVMIGYSDSNKDGGYLMANWSLYQAQETITRAAREQGLRLTIFHGRGGTVARGGGPANRAIRAQPAGSIHGRFRLTEQGETIATRYSNPALAHRHLEQITSAVLLASASSFQIESESQETRSIPTEWRRAMDQMSAAAFRAYRALVYETPRFIEFWQAATPLDEITRLHIGSRPVSRGGNTAVTNIRAIPWVFSWMQSRYNLPGWYGLGSGLELFPDKKLLNEMYAGWPFFRTLLDNAETSLLKADMGIAALYAELVPDRDLAQSMFETILAEYERTKAAVLETSAHTNLMDSEPVTQNAVRLRNPYVDPLNYIQVEILRRLRAQPGSAAEEETLREAVILTINGIAAGLKNTG